MRKRGAAFVSLLVWVLARRSSLRYRTLTNVRAF